MKVRPTDKRPCRLERGEVRRVPQDRRSFLVGYHVCCPRCGFVTAALEGAGGLEIVEGPLADDLTLSQALRCVYCAVLIHVRSGDVQLEEDEHVRRIRYR